MHGPGFIDAGSVPAAPVERTAYVSGISIVAALGGLLFGYDWVVIGGARQFYELYFHLSSAAVIGWANSCALLGCLAGSLAAGYFADRYGRRRVLLLAAVLFAISSALTGWAYSFTSFVVWRIVGGTAIGLSSNISPLYIAEISPAAIRGRLVSLNQFAIVVGILLAQIANWLIARPIPANVAPDLLLYSWNVQFGWRWMFSLLVIPALVFTFASFFIPESPRWLLARGRRSESRDVLVRVGGAAYADTEIRSIEKTLDISAQHEASWRGLLRQPVLSILLMAIGLAVLQQWTGVNILFNYAAEVYRSAGYRANDILLNIVITGTINLLFTILAMLLVDRIGRRRMMFFGCIGIASSHLLCSLSYRMGLKGLPVLLLTLSAIACYALTLAPVTWVLIAEIFPNRFRSQGVSAAVSALWIASFALTYTFPLLNDRLGTANIFLVYGIVCVLGCVLVVGFVPETKGRTLEQIETGLAGSGK